MRITRPRATKLDQIKIYSDLDMGAYNIILGAGQTVDGVDVSDAMTKAVYDSDKDGVIVFAQTEADIKKSYLPLSFLQKKEASEVLRHSHDVEVTHTGDTAWTKKKTITFKYGLNGIIRSKAQIRVASGIEWGEYRIYHNGTPIGASQSSGSGTYAQKTEDITVDLEWGDTLELWVYVSNLEYDVFVKEWRVYYNATNTPIADPVVSDAEIS